MRGRQAKRGLLLGVAAAVGAVVLAGTLLARGNEPASTTSSAGPRPSLELAGTDVITGQEVSLAQFAGKPVVVNIWASWCPGCNAEAAALARFAEAHPEAGFLGIDFQDTEGAARDFYQRYGWEFPSIFDPDGSIAFRLGLQGTPTTIFLDAQHREVARILGETDEAGFAEGLRQAAGAA